MPRTGRPLVVATVIALALLPIGSAAAKPRPVGGGSGWSAATAISGINQPDPTRGSQLNDVAVNANGLTIAAWDQFTYATGGPYTIGAAVQSAGRWGAPFTISGSTGFSLTPRVAVGADGTMAVSWSYQDPTTPSRQSVQVAVKAQAAASWTTTTLATFAVGGVAIVRPTPVAIDAVGNVTAAWNAWDGARNVVFTASLAKGGSWSSPTQLSGTGSDALFLSLAVNERGDGAVAYTLSPYSAYPAGTWAEYVFRAGPDGTWTKPVQVSERISPSVGYVTSPQVALDSNGLATVIYMGYGLEAARQLSGGSWTTGAAIIPSPVFGASFLSPDLGLDGSGNAVVAVAIFDPTIGVDRSSVWVTRGSPVGAWTAALRLTDPTVPVDAYATRVAVSTDGALAVVGWIDHYHGTVQVSRLTSGTWGPASTIGRGTAWSSFQEVLGLDAGSATVARAIWKNAKTGTQTMAANYG